MKKGYKNIGDSGNRIQLTYQGYQHIKRSTSK